MEGFEDYCREHGSFMQSERWAQVKRSWEATYLIDRDVDGRISGTMLVLFKKLPLPHAGILYAPRGPVCDMGDPAALRRLTERAAALAREKGACFLKIDPLLEAGDTRALQALTSLGFVAHTDRVGYENIQCRENYVLPIGGKSADEVMAGFKPKWRYNIRLAVRRGVRCGFYGEEKLGDFMRLMRQTAVRDGFQMRSEEYFRGFLRAFGDNAGLCMTYLGDAPLSGALFVEYGGVMSYVYGCSSDSSRRCMPNYLMQWTMIERAVHHGCHEYDFMGIPYWYDESHPNYGVYRFKQGFGGQVRTYIGELDMVYRPVMYRLLQLAWRIRKRG